MILKLAMKKQKHDIALTIMSKILIEHYIVKKKTSSELEGSTAYCIRCYTHTLNTDCGRSQCQASWLEPSPLGTPECKGSEP